jgi:hypothetical protein
MSGPVVLRADDAIYRNRNVYLGPPGKTLPWEARYIAYVLWLPTYGLILWVESLIGMLMFPPLIEIVYATIIVWGIGKSIDNERPLRTVVRSVLVTHRQWVRPVNESGTGWYRPDLTGLRTESAPRLRPRPTAKESA